MATTVEAIVNSLIQNRSVPQEKIRDVLTKILIDSSFVFVQISEMQEGLMKDELRHIEFYEKTLDKATGIYMFLSPIVSTLDAVVTNRSLNYFYQTKIAHEKNAPKTVNSKGLEIPEKFVSAPVEKEADNFVSEERYMLAVFQGYLDACRQAVQTCRNRLKESNEEKDMVR